MSNTVADLVRTTRESKRLTQEQLAKRSGVSSRTVIRTENNENTPTVQTLAKVFTALAKS